MTRLPLLVLLALTACRSLPVPHSAAEPTPPATGSLQLISRNGSAHGCAVRPDLALTAAHVVDPEPLRPEAPLQNQSWGQGDVLGVAQAQPPFSTRDLAVVRPIGIPFPHVSRQATAPPAPGDRVTWIEYRWTGRDAMAEKRVEARVLRVVAGHLVVDHEPVPGASGGCGWNDEGEVVGIVVWGLGLSAGKAGVLVGAWTGVLELPAEDHQE